MNEYNQWYTEFVLNVTVALHDSTTDRIPSLLFSAHRV